MLALSPYALALLRVIMQNPTFQRQGHDESTPRVRTHILTSQPAEVLALPSALLLPHNGKEFVSGLHSHAMALRSITLAFVERG